MANKHLIEIYRRNGLRYLRLNLKRADPDYRPTLVVRAGWALPEYPETKCQYCKKNIRPQAYNDCGHIYLSIGCCDSVIEDVAWPFTDDYITHADEELEKLGFEYLQG